MSPESLHLPVLFMGHGSPMNAIEDNIWSRSLTSFASKIPRPKYILTISAHWYVPGTFLTADEHPKTIHDFGGFPPELYQVEYPAPGDVDLAKKVIGLIGENRAKLSTGWGLDHGTWSILLYLFPNHDVPVVQLSIDRRLSLSDHLELGKLLKPLRDEGVLILGSGNITHNLRHAFTSYSSGENETPEWAFDFDTDISHAIERRDEKFLLHALESHNGSLSHPTPDHYIPLLFAYGASDENDKVTYPITGFDMGSLSMRSVVWK